MAKPGPKPGAKPSLEQALHACRRKHEQSQRLDNARAKAVQERNAMMADILASYESEGVTLTDLSKNLGVSYGAVKKALTQLGAPAPA